MKTSVLVALDLVCSSAKLGAGAKPGREIYCRHTGSTGGRPL